VFGGKDACTLVEVSCFAMEERRGGGGGLGAAKRAVGPEPIQILKHEKMCFSYLKFEISAE
jgi:hypothetical protein